MYIVIILLHLHMHNLLPDFDFQLETAAFMPGIEIETATFFSGIPESQNPSGVSRIPATFLPGILL